VNVEVASGKPTPLPEDLRVHVRGYERVLPAET